MTDTVYAKNIRRAVDYIEAFIKKKPSYKEAACIAGMSVDNFWRVFKRLFNETIGNYIRARKLTLIARRITSTGKKISDIAFEYGYESPEIFTRAFKKQFFTTPAEYRARGKNLYFYERQKLTEKAIRHFLNGGINLTPGIVTISGFEITGVKFVLRLKRALPDGLAAIGRFLNTSSRLFTRDENKFYSYLKAARGHDINSFSSDSAVEVVTGNFLERLVPGFIRQKVPAGKYAMFVHKGGVDKSMISYEYIFGNWLRRKARRRNAGYFFEIVHRRPPLSSRFEMEIYVPLAAEKQFKV